MQRSVHIFYPRSIPSWACLTLTKISCIMALSLPLPKSERTIPSVSASDRCNGHIWNVSELLADSIKLQIRHPISKVRVDEAPPLSITGVDFTSALYIRNAAGRRRKCYICVFQCAVYKCISTSIPEVYQSKVVTQCDNIRQRYHICCCFKPTWEAMRLTSLPRRSQQKRNGSENYPQACSMV